MMMSALSSRSTRSLWGAVLAGGQGSRLRSFVKKTCGEARPKQFAALTGTRTMLRHTLDRVALEIPDERTLVVTLREHLPFLAADRRGGETTRILAQPQGRGTTPAILYAAHWIRWHDPLATVAVFPSDHFVLEESAFMEHVARVARFVEQNPGVLVLLGARPSGPDREYGWIVPGEAIGDANGQPIHRVQRFSEKPAEAEAKACLAAGGLWNTFVFVAKAAVILTLAARHLPELNAQLTSIAPYAETADSWALGHAYETAPESDFSRDILAPAPPCLAVSRLPDLTWSDWGTPERVRATLPCPPSPLLV